MTVTWGSMNGSEAAANAAFEQECLEQAKREMGQPELNILTNSAMDFVLRLHARAQAIKLERRGKK